MTWFTENKFLAGLIAITGLIAALIIFFGLKASSSFTEVQAQIDAKQASLKKMKDLDPFPTPESAKAKAESLAEVLKKGEEARTAVLAFRPEKIENVPGKDFSENLSATVSRVRELFPGQDALPGSFNLGFEGYSGSLPPEGATGLLTYELAALEYLVTQLAESGGTQLSNLHRAKLPQEDGQDWPSASGSRGGRPGAGRPSPSRPSPSRPGRPTRGGPKVPSFENLPTIAHRMPVELTFRAPESAAREFLTRLANSEEYFFETRLARVVNPAPIPSAGKSAVADAPVDDFGGGDLVIEGAEPEASSASTESVKILEKVSGGDDLVVFLRADLLLFIEEQTLPELK